MKILLLVVAIIATTMAFPSMEEFQREWNQFKATHHRQYSEANEELKRMNIFKDNLKKIKAHNELYEKGQSTYQMGVNQFADLTAAEFAEYVNRAKANRPKLSKINTKEFVVSQNLEVPESVDWREQGAVTEVQDQGICGSCWAFSTTGGLEGQNFLINSELINLSEQELVDCSTNGDNAGCNGGFMEDAFDYVTENGLTSEENYPYEIWSGECRRADKPEVVRNAGYVRIPEGDQDGLIAAIATVGPISVAVDATWWQFYFGGILDDDLCATEFDLLNHGVVAAGYGIENGTEYWLVKNSWGAWWGEAGYIRLGRTRENACGIATDASYPTF